MMNHECADEVIVGRPRSRGVRRGRGPRLGASWAAGELVEASRVAAGASGLGTGGVLRRPSQLRQQQGEGATAVRAGVGA